MADDGLQPATKADLQELKAELKAELKTEFKAELNASLQELELRLREHTENIETRLLTAFQQWASPIASRVRSVESVHGERLSALEERMMAVEKRLVTPPRPQPNQ